MDSKDTRCSGRSILWVIVAALAGALLAYAVGHPMLRGASFGAGLMLGILLVGNIVKAITELEDVEVDCRPIIPPSFGSVDDGD